MAARLPGAGTSTASSVMAPRPTRSTPVPVIGLASGVTAVAANARNLAFLTAWLCKTAPRMPGVATVLASLATARRRLRLTPVPVSGMDSGVTAIAAGYQHSLAVKDGGLYAWGVNYAGELGDGTTTDRLIPVPVIGLVSGVTAIAAGDHHSLAVKDGGVYAWGNNSSVSSAMVQLTSHSIPALVIGLSSGATAVAASRDNSFAVVNGRVYAWGDGTNGGLGNGTFGGISSIPVLVDPTNVTNIIAVAAGGPQLHQNYALSSDGSMNRA